MFATKTAVDAAVAAGTFMLTKYKAHSINIMGSDVYSVAQRGLTKEITSKVDYTVDEIIIDVIQKKYPEHNVLTEETGLIDNGSQYTWVVDPLDGSSNFVNHNPFFAVSICLVEGNNPLTAVIYAPVIEEIVVARQGQGCTLNGVKVKVSETKELDQAYIVGCPGGDPNNFRFSEMSYHLNRNIKDFRKMGSAAIESYLVSSGRVDAFVTLNISPWDIAAGALCVEEAGGKVTDFHGNPWNLDKTDVCMSNSYIHSKVLDKVSYLSERQPDYKFNSVL